VPGIDPFNTSGAFSQNAKILQTLRAISDEETRFHLLPKELAEDAWF
jgi:hypothetical protein